MVDSVLQLTAEPSDCCFVCGADNEQGLQIMFGVGGSGAAAVWRPSSVWEGFRGTIHGGIVSTVLDEAMSKAILFMGYRAVTCDLRVRLRLRVEPGDELCVQGWVIEKRKRRITAEARLMTLDGREKAHAWATFLET